MNTDYTPYAKQRDSLIKSISKKHKIKFNRYHDHCLLEPDFLKPKSKTPYQVFFAICKSPHESYISNTK